MSTNKLLSASLFCLHFFSCCGQVYKTRTNSIFYKSSFSLILCYFPQHCLYLLEPHGTHKSAYFSTLIFLKAFIYGLFCIFSFLILPLKSSVYGSKSGSKMSFLPHLLSFITSSLYHFFLIIST